MYTVYRCIAWEENNLIKVLFVIVGEVVIVQTTISILFITNNTIQINIIKKPTLTDL